MNTHIHNMRNLLKVLKKIKAGLLELNLYVIYIGKHFNTFIVLRLTKPLTAFIVLCIYI